MGEANSIDIIVSDPEIGVRNYGLTIEGRDQVHTSVRRAKARGLLNAATIIITSDFKRARESAEIASEILGSKPIKALELRERFFGRFERGPTKWYDDVWRDDENNPDHTNGDVESANSVLDRTTSLIYQLEARWENMTFLLVSHGDALQILETGFHKLPASEHRSLPHLDAGEIRELTLST